MYKTINLEVQALVFQSMFIDLLSHKETGYFRLETHSANKCISVVRSECLSV